MDHARHRHLSHHRHINRMPRGAVSELESKGTFDAYLIDDQDLAHGCVQDSLGVLLGFTKHTSHKICWVLHDN